MNTDRNLFIRLLCYFGGMLIMTFGVAVSVKADLGVTPLSSIPYTVTVITGMDLGLATILFSIFMVFLQMLLLRKDFKLTNLLQIPVGILFGMFMSAACKSMDFFPDPSVFWLRFLIMLISTVIVAAGVFLYVPSGFITLPPDAFMVVVSQVTKKNFSTVKIICDVTMVTISLISCLAAIHSLGSVGVGTVAAALLVGLEVKGLTKIFSV